MEIIFTFFFYDRLSGKYFLVDIQTIDPGMQWRNAKSVLRNGFNKIITRVNWAFAECLEPIPPKIAHCISSPLNPIPLFSFSVL